MIRLPSFRMKRQPQPVIRDIQSLSAEELVGIEAAEDQHGHALIKSYQYPNLRAPRDPEGLKRAIAMHEWRPDFNQALRFVSEFSLLLPAVSKSPRPFKAKQLFVSLPDNQLYSDWQQAVSSWALNGNEAFGRYSLLWARADRLIPVANNTPTAAVYGKVVRYSQLASVLHAATTGTPLHLQTEPGNALAKGAPADIEWSNTHYTIGGSAYSLWAAKVSDAETLAKLMALPVDILLHVEKETPPGVNGNSQDFMVTCLLRRRTHASGDFLAEFERLGKELTFITRATQLTGERLKWAFLAMVPGSSPTKVRTHRSSVPQWSTLLNTAASQNTVAHDPGGDVHLGKRDGRSVFYRLSSIPSLLALAQSKKGKTTWLLWLLLQTYGTKVIVVQLGRAQNEAAPSLSAKFGGADWELPIPPLKPDELAAQLEEIQDDARNEAFALVKSWEKTGKTLQLPLVIRPQVTSDAYHHWVAAFTSEVRRLWGDLAFTGNELQPRGDFAGQVLAIVYDNLSAVSQGHPLWDTVEDAVNNGRNEYMVTYATAHSQQGLPLSLYTSFRLVAQLQVRGDRYTATLIDPDPSRGNEVIVPELDITLPQYLVKNWIGRQEHRTKGHK